MVSLVIGWKKEGKKSFKEKTRKKSISIGMNIGMALFGELNEYKSNSCPYVPERESKLQTQA